MENVVEAFDQIMESIGSHGKYQKRFIFFYNFMFVAVACMPYVSTVIVAAIPAHWCHIPGRENTSHSLTEWKNMHLPRQENSWGKITYSSCKMYNLTSIRNGINTSTVDEVNCQYGYDYDDTWYTSTIPSSQDWVCDKQMYIANVFAVGTIGEVIGAFVFGQLGDYVGRRPVFRVAIILSFVSKMLSVFVAPYYYVFLLSCFLNNFPSMTAAQSTMAISMEITQADRRTNLAQIQTYGWSLGMVVLSMTCWALPNWYTFVIVTTLPMAVYILTFGLLIESPRWLASRGRIDQCVIQLERIAKVNGTKLKPEMIDTLRKYSSRPEKVHGVMSMCSSWRLVKNTAVLILINVVFTIAMGIFLLNTTNLEGNPFLQFFYQTMVELPGCILGKYLCDRIGRRYSAASSYLIAASMFVPVVLMVKNNNMIMGTRIFILIAKFCMSIALYTQAVQTMEIYPTCIRQTGMSVGIVVSGIFGVATPYLIYIGTAYDARYPYLIISMLCIVAAAVQLFLPETLNVKLPETLQEAKVFGKDQTFFFAPWNHHVAPLKTDREQEKFIVK